jgi:membrane protein
MHIRLGLARGTLNSAARLLRESATAFSEDRARRLSAGLAYYAVFALVPALLASAFIAAAIVGKDASEGTISDAVAGAFGREFALQVEDAIDSAWQTANASGFTILSLIAVTYTASVLFVAWRDTLEVIWDVPYASGVRTTILKRIYGMVIPIVVGLMLAALIIAQTVLTLLSELSRFGLVDVTLQLAGTAIPAVAAVAALAALYRYSTRAAIPRWSHVLRGAAVAWVGLSVLSWGFGIYLRVVGATGVAGAASSVFVGLAVLYYGAQALLFGAEVVQCSADADPDHSWPSGDESAEVA